MLHNSLEKKTISTEAKCVQISECVITLEPYTDLKDPVLCTADELIYERESLQKLVNEPCPLNRDKTILQNNIIPLPIAVRSLLDSLKDALVQNEILKKEITKNKDAATRYKLLARNQNEDKENKNSIHPEETPQNINKLSVSRQKTEREIATLVIQKRWFNRLANRKTEGYVTEKEKLKTENILHKEAYKKEHKYFQSEMLTIIQSSTPVLDKKISAEEKKDSSFDKMEQMIKKWEVTDKAHQERLAIDLQSKRALGRKYSQETAPLILRSLKALMSLRQASPDLSEIKKEEIKLADEWAKQKKSNEASSLVLFGGPNKPKPKDALLERKSLPKIVLDEKQLHLNKEIMAGLSKATTLEAILNLIDQASDINQIRDEKSNVTPLLVACACNNYQLVKELLHRGAAPNIKITSDLDNLIPNLKLNRGCTPLILSIRKSATKIAGLLLEYEADINLADGNGDTPLHWAAWGNIKLEIVNLLISQPQTNPLLKNRYNQTPLEELTATATEKGQSLTTGIIKDLIETLKQAENFYRDRLITGNRPQPSAPPASQELANLNGFYFRNN